MEFTQLILSQSLGLGEKKKSTSGLPFTKERNRENEKDPGKWTQNRIGKKSQAVPLDQISSKPNFEILQDEGLVTPSKSNHHGTVQSFSNIVFVFVFNRGGIKPQWSPNKKVRPSPFMLAWVTNVSTRPDLYIEFSTDLIEIFRL